MKSGQLLVRRTCITNRATPCRRPGSAPPPASYCHRVSIGGQRRRTQTLQHGLRRTPPMSPPDTRRPSPACATASRTRSRASITRHARRERPCAPQMPSSDASERSGIEQGQRASSRTEHPWTESCSRSLHTKTQTREYLLASH